MTTWAYPCRLCRDPEAVCFAACSEIDAMPADTAIVQVKVGRAWRCAELDRSERKAVQAQLIRQAVPAGVSTCEECQDA